MRISQKEKAALVERGEKKSLQNDYSDVPCEMREQAKTWVLWKYTDDGRKMPDDWTYTPGAKYKGADNSALHLSFDAAVAKLHTRMNSAGIGLYLGDGVRLTVDGREGWLWVLDLDGFAGADDDGPLWEPQAVELWKVTSKTYVEGSPSGTGLKLYFVSDVPPVGKQIYSFGPGQFAAVAPEVRKYLQREIEVFSRGYYIAVTGRNTAGTLRFLDDVGMIAVMQWLDEHGVKKANGTPALAPLGFEIPPYIARAGLDCTTRSLMGTAAMAETEANIEQVQQWLEAVDADCDYETWRNLIWAVASLEWECGEELVREWSMTAADRYDEVAFNRTWQSYRPGGVGIGTLARAAREAGYQPPVASVPAMNGTQQEGTRGSAAGPTGPTVSPALAASGWTANTPRYNLAELTANRLFTGAPPKQDWLVEGIFPRGKLAVLASPPGIGKSYLALQLSRLVSGDKPGMILGGYARAGGRAIYVSAEDDQGELHRRLHALVVGGSMPDRLHILSLPDVGHFGIIQADQYTKALKPTAAWLDLVGEIKSLTDVRLIVLDTLQALSTGDTNSADAVQPLMNECSELAAATGATVLLIHHVGKSSTRDIKTALDAAESIRGSGAIVGSARAAYVLWPPADGGRKLCEMIDEPYVENALAIGIVAKANGAASRKRTYFLRDESGLLRDITARVEASSAEDIETSLTELMSAIRKAWDDGAPFAASYGANGLHTRRHELTEPLREKARPWFDKAVGALINADRVKRIPHKSGHQLAPADYIETDDREGE